MKKFILMLCAVFGLSLNMVADTTSSCKISGGQDGATVIASVVEVGDGYVLVEISNDGSFAVNVRISISGYASGNKGTIAKPQQSTVVKVPVPNAKSSQSVNQYHVKINGSRCN